ncbi:PREDICTED: uncharacterized protein LOC109473497 [Branchiostoma belcheri]|uniref:Uncharacterized protein LOC109473497 n=1 Tax=Branchiostoma belcheri TaxID=7741 RepID=A0A6P4YHW5_BRABE|nr:PREDICTED: uncharacterized protein LOC109473497 [Branchiostoma belcheri]
MVESARCKRVSGVVFLLDPTNQIATHAIASSGFDDDIKMWAVGNANTEAPPIPIHKREEVETVGTEEERLENRLQDDIDVSNLLAETDQTLSAHRLPPTKLHKSTKLFSILRAVVPNTENMDVGFAIIWGVLEMIIEKTARPFKLAPIMPYTITAAQVLTQIWVQNKAMSLTSHSAIDWCRMALEKGQHGLLDNFDTQTWRDGDCKYTVATLKDHNVYAFILPQENQPSNTRTAQLTAVLIHLMMYPDPPHIWANQRSITNSFVGEAGMKFAIAKESVIPRCTKALLTKGKSKEEIAERVQQVLTLISLTNPNSILSTLNFNHIDYMADLLKVRQTKDTSYEYAGLEVWAQDDMRIDVSVAEGEHVPRLSWTNIVDRKILIKHQPQPLYLLPVMARLALPHSQTMADMSLIGMLAAEGNVRPVDVLFEFGLVCHKSRELLLWLYDYLRHLKRPLLPPESTDYYGSHPTGNEVTDKTLDLLMRNIVATNITAEEYADPQAQGNRVMVLYKSYENGEPHYIIYDEKRRQVTSIPQFTDLSLHQARVIELLNRDGQAILHENQPMLYQVFTCVVKLYSIVLTLSDKMVILTQIFTAIETVRKAVLGQVTHPIAPFLSLLITARDSDIDRFNYVSLNLYSKNRWGGNRFKGYTPSVSLGQHNLLWQEFSKALISVSDCVHLPDIHKANTPISRIDYNGTPYFITLEGEVRRMCARDTNLEPQPSMNHTLRILEANKEDGSSSTATAPNDRCIDVLPPALAIYSLYRAYFKVRKSTEDRENMVAYAVRHWDKHCKLYKIQEATKPVTFGNVLKTGIKLLKPLVEKYFYSRPTIPSPTKMSVEVDFYSPDSMHKIDITESTNWNYTRYMGLLTMPSGHILFGRNAERHPILAFVDERYECRWLRYVLGLHYVHLTHKHLYFVNLKPPHEHGLNLLLVTTPIDNPLQTKSQVVSVLSDTYKPSLSAFLTADTNHLDQTFLFPLVLNRWVSDVTQSSQHALFLYTVMGSLFGYNHNQGGFRRIRYLSEDVALAQYGSFTSASDAGFSLLVINRPDLFAQFTTL